MSEEKRKKENPPPQKKGKKELILHGRITEVLASPTKKSKQKKTKESRGIIRTSPFYPFIT
jgi:hypothetical protein